MTEVGYLHRYFLNNTQRLHKWLHYFDIYERHFAEFRDRPITLLEIGVHGGGSLEMWRDYFHPDSQIVGIDINPACAAHAHDNIDVHIGSQDDPALLASLVEKYGEFDIIVDDGSHMNAHMVASFEALYPSVKQRGVYMVEDMHTSYLPKYDGGLQRRGTFAEFVKDRIDELHSRHIEGADKTAFSMNTRSISIYDAVVVFEKELQSKRMAIITGPA